MSDSQRKLNKAVYLIIEKYHRLYGLEAYLFSGGHGPGYVGFQVAANRCWDGSRNEPNYGSEGEIRLVTYITGQAGIPAWVAGQQMECNGWEMMRTHELVEWLERALTLDALFTDNARKICSWRMRYTVLDSEKYLLMVRLAGIMAAKRGDFPRTPSQCFSDYDNEAKKEIRNILKSLDLPHEENNVMGTVDCQIGRNGKAIIDGRIVDVWQEFDNGASDNKIISQLMELTHSGI